MSVFARYDENGKYLWCGNSTIGKVVESSKGIYAGQVNIFAQYHDIVNDCPVDIPPKPAAYCKFNWVTKQWDDPRTIETEWGVVRARRSALLTASDWVVVKATETGEPASPAWQDYRQALRDVTSQPDPFNISWPTQP